ncbi:MAG: C-GCAxxG-C-C family (seleno)protein [Candidatus Ventricola sp.]
MLETRRQFLKKSVAMLGGATLLASVPFAGAMAESQPEAPAHPFPYAELDLDAVEKAAYEGYFEDGCCYGVAKGLLTELCAKVGFPYTMIPPAMFANGKEGYTAGTLCGALGGAAGIIGLCCAPADAREITKQLFAWYTSTALPIYQPESAAPVQTVSPSVNCIDSISTFMTAANVERGDIIRKRRCGGVSGDVARKTAELLNIHFGFMAAPAVAEAETELAANEYIGEANGFGGPIKVKVTMDGDKIAKIDVLSHGDTPGICDKAFNTIPQAIIDAQSTQVDVASGATFSSQGIMAAVEDALSKVGK